MQTIHLAIRSSITEMSYADLVNQIQPRKLTIFLVEFLTLLFLIFIRTKEKISYPGIWVEDSVHLQDMVSEGFSSLLNPTSNFLHFGTRLLTAVVQIFTIEHYPTVSIWLTVLITSAICMGVRKLFGGPQGLVGAIAIILVPSDPEVFGLPSYLFWFFGIYLIAFAISDYHRQAQKTFVFNLILLFVFGLSGPVGVLLLPIYALRLIQERGRQITNRSYYAFAVNAITSIVQISCYFSTQVHDDSLQFNSLKTLLWPIKAMGSYFVGIQEPDLRLITGVGMISLLLIPWLWRSRFSYLSVSLSFLVVLAAIQTSLRVNTEIIHPTIAAPRYFFIVFVLTGWIITFAIFELLKTLLIRTIVFTFILFLFVVNVDDAIDRRVSDFHWRSYASSCQYFEALRAPVLFDGSYQESWTLDLNKDMCRPRLLDFTPDSIPSMAFRYIEMSNVELFSFEHANQPCADSIISRTNFVGSDYFQSEINGYQIIGSFISQNDTSPHSLILRIQKGNALLFRWGTGVGQTLTMKNSEINERFVFHLPPTQDWVYLIFDNAALPDEFEISFSDDSDSWGAWSAVALRSVC